MWFANDHLSRDQKKIVIHGNSYIILYLFMDVDEFC